MVIDTLVKSLVNLVEKQPHRVALRKKDFGIWHDITWSEYLQNVKYVALGLHDLGVKKADHVAIMGENQPEWLYSALGTMAAGAAFVGIYTTNPAAECEYVVNNSNSVVFICEDEEQLDKALVFRDRAPQLLKMIVWDMEGLRHFKDQMLMSFDELLGLGKTIEQENPDLFYQLVNRGKPEDIASLIYTSGTTGPPKGVMLSNENYLWQGKQEKALTEAKRDDEGVSFLPLCHVGQQAYDIQLHLSAGHIVNFTESTDTLMRDMVDITPTLFACVPRIWEKYYSYIVLRMDEATWLKRTIYGLALKIGDRYNGKILDGKTPSLLLNLAYKLAYFVVFRKLKKRIGFQKVRLGLSGAAPISHNVLKFFRSIGIPIGEIYGMTESCGAIAMSTKENFKLGRVGKLLPETELKIAEDGEIIARHKGVFRGYYRDQESTEKALVDGWIHTGDVGEIDEEGYLSIKDRKKDLIITSGGKNIAPQYIENLLKFSPYINDAVVIGDQRKYLTALIVIDDENVIKYAQREKIQYTTYSSLTKSEEVIALIHQEVNKVKLQVSRVENIKKFRILDKKLYVEDSEVTPTMKVKRKAMEEQYKDLIESMYR